MIRIKSLAEISAVPIEERGYVPIFPGEMLQRCGRTYDSPEALYRESDCALASWMYVEVPEEQEPCPAEQDPNGLKSSDPGAKLDHGKPRCAVVLGGFARALMEVSKVGTYGIVKYSENGWTQVDNGPDRYDDAGMRHWLYEKMGEVMDKDTALRHAAHDAWNALARLDLMIREGEK